ncbi:MAG: NUDIX domain-containing protein [Oscillospiraceae bacterium]|jgi:ADP-ribose pyrophosphatase YjhB (NUDIX family)|nr:NUDIX domain-containing protein [Oscillospiraceae bacterium]
MIEEQIDCCFTSDEKWFRYRAAAIIIENNCVLFANNESVDYFYSVGGGVKHGETAEQAVIREVFEETGVKYKIDRLAFIHENFFSESIASLKGLDCHEITLFFLMKPRGTQEINCKSYCIDGREFMNWIPISDLEKLKAYPTFFTEKLTNLSENIEHIVTIDNRTL